MSTEPVTRASLLSTLGLAQDATAPEIKAAYRKEAKRWHPDTANASSVGKHEAEQKFMEIRAAYEQLVKQPRTSRTGDVYTTEGVRASENAQKMTRSPGNVRAQELRRYAHSNSTSSLPLKVMTGLILTMTIGVAADIYGRRRFPWQQPGGADIRDLRIFQPGSLLSFFGKR